METETKAETSRILANIFKYLPSWAETTHEMVAVTRLPGCSNKTFKIQVLKLYEKSCKATPKVIIYREFGRLEEFIDYETESKVFDEMGRLGLGPKNYGFCSEFRLEELIEAEHPKNPEMLDAEFIKKMAETTAKFHLVDMNLKSQEPMMRKMLGQNSDVLSKVRVKLAGNSDLKDLQAFFSKEETLFLLENLPIEEDSVTFCHNDLNPTNIFTKNDEILLLDFEYAGYNYRGFDIAGYFIEIAYDYSDFPNYCYRPELLASEEIISQFCYFYLKYLMKDKMDEETLNKLKKLVREVKIGLLNWLFFTSLWCVYMAESSKIEFDYLGMAKDKFKRYNEIKKKYFEFMEI